MAGLKRCAIKLCKNTSEDGFSMFTITERRRTKLNWLTLCDLPESTPKHAYICEGHFTKDQTEIIDIYDGTRLKSNAVPTILSPNPPKLFVKQTVGTYIVEGVDEKGNHILKLDPEEPFQQIKLLRSSPVKDASTSEAVVSSTASEDTPPAPETPSFNAQEAKCRMLEEKLSRSNEKVLELQKEMIQLLSEADKYLSKDSEVPRWVTYYTSFGSDGGSTHFQKSDTSVQRCSSHINPRAQDEGSSHNTEGKDLRGNNKAGTEGEESPPQKNEGGARRGRSSHKNAERARRGSRSYENVGKARRDSPPHEDVGRARRGRPSHKTREGERGGSPSHINRRRARTESPSHQWCAQKF